MNILVISSYFGPETSVGVLRINSFVKNWAELGHRIYVFTMPYAGELPDGIRGNANIKVFQIPPYFIGSRQSGGVQGYSKGAKGATRRILKLQYWLKRHIFSNYLDPRVLWWPRVALYIFRRFCNEVKIDFMLSTVPSYTAHSAAAAVKLFRKKLLWVADYRDLWCGNPIFPGCALVRLFEKFHERIVLKHADLIVSINDSLISDLSNIHGHKNYLVVPNGFEDCEVNIFKAMEASDKKQIINIVYAGSILPVVQDPSPLLQALKELAAEGLIKEGDILVSFFGDHSALENFPLVSDKSVVKFIQRCGKVPRREILRIQKNADFLLFLGSQQLIKGYGSTVGVISGKIFEYLISGTEVMAVGVTDNMLVADMLKKSASGDYYGSNVEKLKSRIVHAVKYGVKKIEPDMNYLDQYRRSTQAKKLINEIQTFI